MASPPFRFLAATALAIAATLSMPSAQAASASTSTTRWSSNADWAKGSSNGVAISGGSLRISKPLARIAYQDPYGNGKKKNFDYSAWTSPWVTSSAAIKNIVASWNAATPGATWVRIMVRAKTAKTTGSFDTVADWEYGTAGTHRNSGTTQADDIAKVNVDTVLATGSNTFTAWQVKIHLFRPTGSTDTPTVSSLGAVAATFSTRAMATSKTTMTAGVELAVPRYSQMIHRGQYPQYAGGGASWCSPTSTMMVLRYFKSGPTPAAYPWSKYADSFVVHAARFAYDYRYKAAGNWPFNTAYAGLYGLDSFVTRLNDLRDAESFIKRGIPVVAAVKYAKGALAGAPVATSAGHLLVIVGFAEDGRVIANDPAAASNSSVRRVYNRAQFERAWLGGSGGISYVIRPASTPLPPSTGRW